MAAAATSSYMSQSHSQAGSSGTFSPLTMFECTISSATMLIDSMAVRDLLMAFKIVAQLHGHLLEVLDPTVQRLANVADEHSLCPPPIVAATPTPSCSTFGKAGGIRSDTKVELSDSLAEEQLAEEDDCILVETDVRQLFDSGSGGSHQQQLHHVPAKLPRLSANESVDSLASTGELSNEWKSTLRKAYRVLKEETGSEVFDFNLSYSTGANVRAAKKVIERALTLGPNKPANLAAWQKASNAYMQTYYTWTLKPCAKRQRLQNRLLHSLDRQKYLCLKLNRRQQAYEAVKGQLDADTRAKIESAALNRDYTSSDEEIGGAAGDSDQQLSDELQQQQQNRQYRVRSLPWESEELRRLKERLDAVAPAAAAAGGAPVARREPGHFSDRPAPANDGLDWARNSAASTAAGDEGNGFAS